MAAFTTAGVISNQLGVSAAAKPSSDKLSVHLFSKHLQFLDYEEMARVAADMGFDGLDLTVRPKGHVEPANVQQDLHRAVDAMTRHGLPPVMFVSGVRDANDPVSVQVLKTASKLGFKYYRLAYYRFDTDCTWKQNMDRIRASFTGLVKLNEQLGLHGAYQNHSGTSMGAYLPDVAYVLDGQDPRWAGCQYDIRHGDVDGGRAWPVGLRWVKDHIKTIAIKDYVWGTEDGERKVINVPLGEGIVNFDKYFKLLRSYEIHPIVSLHCEYELGGAGHGHREITIPRGEVYSAIHKDLETLHELWRKSA